MPTPPSGARRPPRVELMSSIESVFKDDAAGLADCVRPIIEPGPQELTANSTPLATRGIHSVLGPPREPKYHPLSCSRGREVATAWVPRPSDVMITTFPKTGTTWLQQICHQLRNGGKGMDFMEVTQVMPWPEFAYECGQDLEEDASREQSAPLQDAPASLVGAPRRPSKE